MPKFNVGDTIYSPFHTRSNGYFVEGFEVRTIVINKDGAWYCQEPIESNGYGGLERPAGNGHVCSEDCAFATEEAAKAWLDNWMRENVEGYAEADLEGMEAGECSG